ncbi:MAG: hypothetical protein M0P66_13620 [Salinivirgaceae bacterium]|nr:hypothetical protein [Salinivirgaceae bacterium]
MTKKHTDTNYKLDFLKRIHNEKMESQKRRADFNIRKFIFIGTLFTLGAAKLPKEIDLTLVLYIVPFISLCFDLYILGEDYGIKRMGGFVRQNYKNAMDSTWEEWVGKRRDPFATFAVPLLSTIVLFSCSAILWKTESNNFLFWIWLCLLLCSIIFLFLYSQFLRKKLLIKDMDKKEDKR